MILSVLSDSSSSNSYIVGDGDCAIIDAGMNPSKVLEKINEIHIMHYVFINTHCHFDHVGFLQNLGESEVMMHYLDAEAVEKADEGRILSSLFGTCLKPIKVSRKLEDGERIRLGKMILEVVHTPGHTPGSMCLYEPETKSLFTGDTLFKDGVGRTDFPGGSFKQLKESVEKLVELHDSRGVGIIYPGHGQIGKGEAIRKVYDMIF
ncbi:MAG: MBL fold metallo-hydrolase [Candidatus Altiarchaeota archaeon]